MGIKSREAYLDKENNLIYDSTILNYLYSDELIDCIRVRLAERFIGNIDGLSELPEGETISKIRNSAEYKKFRYVTDINKALGDPYGSSLSLAYEIKAHKFHIIEEIKRGEVVANTVSTDVVCIGEADIPEVKSINCAKCKELEHVVIYYNYNYFDKEIILPDKEDITLNIVIRGNGATRNYTNLDIKGCSKYIKLSQSILYECCIEKPIYIIPWRCSFSSIRADEMSILLETDKLTGFKDEETAIARMTSCSVKRLNVNIDGTNYNVDNARTLDITFLKSESKVKLGIWDEDGKNYMQKVIKVKK